MSTRNLFFGLIAITSIYMVSCKTSAVESNMATIKGEILNADGRQILLEDVNGNSAFAVDTAVVGGNKVTLGADVDAGMFRLRFPELRNVQGPLIYLDNDSRLEMKFDTEDPSAYSISGDEENVMLHKVLKRQDEMARQSVELKNTINTSPDQAERTLANQQLQELVNQSAVEVKQVIEDSKYLDPNLTAFLLNLLDPASNMVYIQTELKALKEQAPNSKLIAQMNSRFTMPEKKKNSGIAIGAQAPDIVQNNPSGQPIALSSLRGKYVLIDFWASWCRPCRFENPNVVKTYHKYKDQGFDIYSVSLDKNKDRWSKAIKDDNLVWPSHVSDLKAWSNVAARSYGVSSIPATFLLDPEGNVIARNLRGPALEEKLIEVLGSN